MKIQHFMVVSIVFLSCVNLVYIQAFPYIFLSFLEGMKALLLRYIVKSLNLLAPIFCYWLQNDGISFWKLHLNIGFPWDFQWFVFVHHCSCQMLKEQNTWQELMFWYQRLFLGMDALSKNSQKSKKWVKTRLMMKSSCDTDFC